MRYAKLNDGAPVFAPNPIKIDGCWWSNPPAEILRAEGYKPVRYTEAQTPEPGYIAVPGWTETEAEIVQTWAVEQEPDEISEDRAWRILTGEEEKECRAKHM